MDTKFWLNTCCPPFAVLVFCMPECLIESDSLVRGCVIKLIGVLDEETLLGLVEIQTLVDLPGSC